MFVDFCLSVVAVFASVVSDGRPEKQWKIFFEARNLMIAADLDEGQQQRHQYRARETRAREATPSDS